MIHDFFEDRTHKRAASGYAHLRQSLHTAVDCLDMSRKFLADTQDMLKPFRPTPLRLRLIAAGDYLDKYSDVLSDAQEALDSDHFESLHQHLEPALDRLAMARKILADAKDMLRPSLTAQLRQSLSAAIGHLDTVKHLLWALQLRAYIEDVLGAPCIADGCRPGEMIVHPANFCCTGCGELRIALLFVDDQTRILLATGHNDAFSAGHAALRQICGGLQGVLDEDEPGSTIYITHEGRLRLCMDVPISCPEDVAGVFLRALFLVHKFHNAIFAELDLTRWDEEDAEEAADEACEDEEGEASFGPLSSSIRHGSPRSHLKTHGFRFSQSEAFRRMTEEYDEACDEAEADGDPFSGFDIPPVPPRRPRSPMNDSEGGMNDEHPF